MDFYKKDNDTVLRLNASGEYEVLPPVDESVDVIVHYSQKFDVLEDEIQSFFTKINESVNKGAHMVKLKFYQDKISTHLGIGDYSSLSKKVEEFISEISQQINENRHRNLQQKTVLLDALKSIVDENNWKALDAVKELHQNWIRIGKATEEFDADLNDKFEVLKTTFFEHRKEYAETQKELYDARADTYREIIQELEDFTEAKDWKDHVEQVKGLQDKWKNNGAVPKVVYDSLYPLFKKSMDAYFSKLKADRKASKKQNKENTAGVLGVKKTVLAELNDYLKQENSTYLIKDAITFRQKWNSAGKVSFKLLNDIADEFYLNLEYLFEFINVNKFLEKKGLERSSENQLKAVRRFYHENKKEIETYTSNKEGMFALATNSDVSQMVERRQRELERKLKAKKMMIDFLEKK